MSYNKEHRKFLIKEYSMAALTGLLASQTVTSDTPFEQVRDYVFGFAELCADKMIQIEEYR